MELPVVDSSGQKASTLQASDEAFGVEFNEPLVHQIVVAYQAGARAGTRAQKGRSDVRGGGSKPYRQKGTGRARAGTARSPIWRGGGKVFAASPKDHGQKVNRKMYRAGMRSIISELIRQDRLVVCDTVTVDAPKTKTLVDMLAKLNCRDVLLVTHEFDRNLWLSARNLYRVDVCEVGDVDPVSLVGHEKVLVTSEAVKKLEEWLQ